MADLGSRGAGINRKERNEWFEGSRLVARRRETPETTESQLYQGSQRRELTVERISIPSGKKRIG